MRRIKIAQIGVNTYSHGGQIFQGLARRSDLFELVGYALPENERERLPGRVSDLGDFPELTLDEILNDPSIEAVAVETDEIYTTKYAILAAEHGKHIHMEKPGGRELPDFERLISLMRENGKVFHTGYMYRYNPLIRRLIDRIRAGELGEIVSVEAQMNCFHPVWVRNWLAGFPGGMMFFLGCHLVDLVLQIQGTPDNIIPLNRRTGLDNALGTDFGMAILEYGNGVSMVKTTDVERGGFLRRQLVVTGSRETVEIRPLEEYAPNGLQRTEQTSCTEEAWDNSGEHTVSDAFDRYDAMLAAFAAMVRGEIRNPYTLDYELTLYKTVLRCCGIET